MMGPPDFRTPSKSNGPLAQLAATPSQPLRTPIHQTSATPIVDLDTIERNKENILQLRGGRSAHALSKSFSTPHKDRTAALEAKRREYETIIASSENAESDDPLEVWYKYVMWVIEAYPAGHSVESGLVSLLERVTRHFKDFAQYRNDPRYLKMWVFYARNVDCARDIYQFCLANEMGTNLATLYEQLAVTYQSSSIYHEADAIYRLGIARRAQPLERIKRSYEGFQAYVKGSYATGRSGNGGSGSHSGRSSPALTYEQILQESAANYRADLDDGGSRRGLQARVSGNSRARQANPSGSSSARTTSNERRSYSVYNGTNLNSARTAVFEDPDEPHGGEGRHASRSAQEPWTDVGTRISRRQENALEPSTMAGTKISVNNGMIKRKGGVGGPAVSAFDIFQDDDDDDDEGAGDERKGEKKLIKEQQELTRRESDELKKNPFKHWSKDIKLKPNRTDLRVAGSSSQSIASKPASGSAIAPSRKGEENYAVPIELLYPEIAISTLGNPVSTKDGSKTKGCMLSSDLTGERPVESVLVEQRFGVNALSATVDPWSHLDAHDNKWLPEPKARSTSAGPAPVTAAAATKKPALGVKLSREGSSPKKAALGIKGSSSSEKLSTPAAKKTALGEKKVVLGQKLAAVSSENVPKQQNLEAKKPALGEKKSALGEKKRALGVKAPTLAEMKLSAADNVEADQVPSRVAEKHDEPVKRAPSPTLVTKAAMREVENMFNGSEDEDEDSDTDSDSDEEVDDEDDVRQAPAAPAAIVAPATPVPSTPIRKPFQPTRNLVASGQPDLAKPLAHSAQRVNSLTEEDEEEEEEYGPQPGALAFEGEQPDYRHALSPITEVTEVTRWTNLNTPATAKSSRLARLSPSHFDDEERASADSCTPAKMLVSIPDDSSFASNSRTTPLAHADDPSQWGDKVQLNIPDGLTVACRQEVESIDQLSHERIGSELVYEAEVPVETASGAFVIPNPCSPDDEKVVHSLLSALDPPLSTYAGFVDCSHKSADGRLQSLENRHKQNKRKSSSSSHTTTVTQRDWKIQLDGHAFQIRRKLGEGGFASVYLAEDMEECAPRIRKRAADDLDSSIAAELDDLSVDSELDDEAAELKRMVALKVEQPANQWEFYMLHQLHQRLSARTTESIIPARKFLLNSDESCLLLQYGEKGTLLELVNHAHAAGVGAGGIAAASGAGGNGVEEVLAMFFVIELMRIVEDLHSKQLIHGDLKIDNCLLRIDDAPAGVTWSNAYDADGSDGWASKGLTLIDFGRAIDLALYPAGQRFVSTWKTETRDCSEMRQGKPWTYEADYHGIAAVAYCLLYGKYLETIVDENAAQPRNKFSQPLRRYWQTDLWQDFFELMLNPVAVSGSVPIAEDMHTIRERMQTWLSANCNRSGKNLKGMIKKIQIWCMDRE